MFFPSILRRLVHYRFGCCFAEAFANLASEKSCFGDSIENQASTRTWRYTSTIRSTREGQHLVGNEKHSGKENHPYGKGKHLYGKEQHHFRKEKPREGETPFREGKTLREGKTPIRERNTPIREGTTPFQEGEPPREGETPFREGKTPYPITTRITLACFARKLDTGACACFHVVNATRILFAISYLR